MTTDFASTQPTDEQALLVTGAAGRTGGYAAQLLLERGHRVRALVHRFDDRAATLRDRGAEVIVGDLHDIDAVRNAAKGARAAYFVYPISPGLLEATTTFAQAAAEAGVTAIVNMSQISARRGAASDATRIHWLGERILDWSPVAATHLRPTYFAEWFTIFGAQSIRDEGVLRLPFGDGRHAPITAEDQGRVIAAILEHPEDHAGQVYPLFGAVEMNHHQIAEAISEALGRPVRYEPTDIPTWIAGIKAQGFPEFLAQHLSNVAVDYRNGIFAGNNDLVERIGGKKPTTVQEFITAHLAAFS
ncbi:NmrA family NAD(P)-binding protein [Mycobacterium cookii]|uniref:NmrA family transcriptional regulator n=1 Tax=Mycobacterium cookii TaxID=1775 RepID=A0A7I7L1V8_9MYCO|nr:NmrA family NAD(P)-binding protein [Mycobacterium cookii]MCV7333228.1 NmrA family NAD(P)-binding protein [Mycobacterium cookii]BBX47758.1 NmrA family transcriptional regulator [Mycobacterium cookii]